MVSSLGRCNSGVRVALAEDADFRPRGPLGNDGGSGCGSDSPRRQPLAVEHLYLDNYFSIAKARRDLG